MKNRIVVGACWVLTAFTMAPLPAAAQDFGASEVIVTATRIEIEEDAFDSYNTERPAIGLVRTADFLVQEVVIRGDTRNEDERRSEIRAMLAEAVRLAPRYGVELAYGDYILTQLTSANLDEITLGRDNRPDSERVDFLVKAKLGDSQSGAEAQAKIAAYVEAVPETGRAQMDGGGDPTLSIVGPDQYRYQVIAEIARDAKRLTDALGEGYAVEITGLNQPIQWARAGLSQVQLYIPYGLKILPRP